MGVPELDYCCPFCGTPTRGLEELVFTEDEDLIFYKGKALRILSGRRERQVFKYLFARRGRLVLYGDLYERFGGASDNKYALTRVHIRRIRQALREYDLPINIRNVSGEGYIMNVTAIEIS